MAPGTTCLRVLPSTVAVAGALAFYGCAPAPHATTEATSSAAAVAGSRPKPQTAPSQDGAVDMLHGIEVRDPFRWMETPSPRLDQWISAHDRTARSFLDGLPIRSRLLSTLQDDKEPPQWTQMPFKRGGVYFYSRIPRGHEYGLVLSLDPKSKKEQTVLDLDDLHAKENLVVDWWGTSKDGRYLLFRMSPNRSDVVQARIFDRTSQEWLPEHISDFRYSYPTWDAKSGGFFYTWAPQDPSLSADKRAAASQIRFHKLRTNPDSDPTVKPPTGQSGVLEAAEVSPDNRWLLVARWSNSARDSLWLMDREAREPKWVQFTPEKDARFDSTFGRRALYISTQVDAPHGHVFLVNPAHPDQSLWREVVPERPDATLASVDAVGDFLILTYVKDAQKTFEIHKSDGSFVKSIVPPGAESILAVGGTPLQNDGMVAVNSYTQPYTPYVMDAPEFRLERFPTSDPILPPDAYPTEKVFYTSPDGTRAPIFIVRSSRTPPHQAAPLILHAYGAFGDDTEPGYRRGLAAWLDQGGAYADAVIRGGGEYGEAWHRNGMGERRANTYADFLAASEFLIRDGWTTREQLVIRGGSAGGLLMSVALTEQPSLFAGAGIEAPHTAMHRFT